MILHARIDLIQKLCNSSLHAMVLQNVKENEVQRDIPIGKAFRFLGVVQRITSDLFDYRWR